MSESDAAAPFPLERVLPWLMILLAAGFVLPLCQRGIILSDEGYLLQQALDMANGKVLYRDMDAFVTPGIWFVLAGLFEIVEPNVLVSRIPIFVAFLGLLGFAYRIVHILANRGYAIGTMVLLMGFSVWAFPAWTFTFYSPFAVLFSLVGLERLLVWRRDEQLRDLLLCGVALGIAITFKQNYGAFASLGVLLSLFAIRLERNASIREVVGVGFADALRVGAGMAVIAAPLLLYFTLNGALPQLYESLVLQPFYFMGRHDIPYLGPSSLFEPWILDGTARLTYGATPLYSTESPVDVRLLGHLHVLLYLIPPVAFFAGGVGLALGFFERRSLDAGWFAVLAVCGLVFMGVFPRADFNHLANVYQVVIVAGMVTFYRLAGSKRGWASNLGWAAMLPLLLTSAYWYFSLIDTYSSPVPGPRGGVLIHPLDAMQIGKHIEFIEQATPNGEALLTVPDLTMLNFLAQRPVPSRYYNLYEHHISKDGGAEVVEMSEKAGVPLAITRYDNFFSDRVGLRDYAPVLFDYLRTHFDHQFTLGTDHALYLVRRPVPRSLESTAQVLGGCGLDERTAGGVWVRTHLLFDSLYHYPGRFPVETHCRVEVPEHGQLAVELGYRPPERADEGTFFKAEISIAGPDGTERIMEQKFDVHPNTGWKRPPMGEFRADLSEFAGQEVVLIFRTTSAGHAEVNYFDPKGFAFVWEEPRIEVLRAQETAAAEDPPQSM